MAPLTVKALREQLAALPDDAPVVIEGCDCVAEAMTTELVPRGANHWPALGLAPDHGAAVVVRRYGGDFSGQAGFKPVRRDEDDDA